MAKAGFWLRGAKGKLAGASMGRGANGQTIMREIVKPKNPRTNAQLMQRAVMATVMQAYSAGKVIFDHSFQGRSVGAPNQQRFMSLNARRLRSIIAADIDGAVAADSQNGRVVAPGVPSPVPCKLQVSEGTLANTILAGGKWATALSGETIAQYVARMGLTQDDLFTFVCFLVPNNATVLFSLEGDNTVYSKQFATQFIWARYKIKESAFTASGVAEGAGFTDIFELTEANFNVIARPAPDLGAYIGPSILYSADAMGSFAWIRSKLDQDLRSSENMIFDDSNEGYFGIVSSFALAAWKQGAGNLGDSELILEGGDL